MRRNEEVVKRAMAWTGLMNQRYQDMISTSVANTKRYTEFFTLKEEENGYDTEIIVTDEDSVTAIMNHKEGKTAVLNFASYKRPGGGFIDGMLAQEEALCHESFLYNVLSQFPGYYSKNKEDLNSGFYRSRALYSPDILFKESKTCDVITCAAPNASRMLRYQTGQEKENAQALAERVLFVLNIAAEQKVDTLILGAYGCGVFKQNPKDVAALFKYYLNTVRKRSFKKVVFAIPMKASANHQAFLNEFGETLK